MNTELEKFINEFTLEMVSPACTPGAPIWSARISIPRDASEVFPYLNAALPNTNYNHKARVLLWERENGFRYAFRPNEIAIAPIEDRTTAEKLCEDVITLVCDIWERRHEIEPDFKGKPAPPSIIAILKCLPGTNCKECGYPTCMAFAAALMQGKVELEICGELLQESNAENRRVLSELIR